MSPSLSPGFQAAACQVCREALLGPLVTCGVCGAYVHSQCSVGLLQDNVCENCFAQFRLAEDARRSRELQQQAARRLGLAGARNSELIGAALGAISAAGAAATRYFVAGASAGARSAWQGSTRAPRQPAWSFTSSDRPPSHHHLLPTLPL